MTRNFGFWSASIGSRMAEYGWKPAFQFSSLITICTGWQCKRHKRWPVRTGLQPKVGTDRRAQRSILQRMLQQRSETNAIGEGRDT